MNAMDTEAATNSIPGGDQYSTPNPPPAGGGQYPPNPAPAVAKTSSGTASIFNIVNLVIRILTFIFLFVALILMSLAKETIPATDYAEEITLHFNSFTAYRYAMSAIVLGFAYTIAQTGISLLRLVAGFGRATILLTFNFYGDKVISYLLATGAAAGFGLGVDEKRMLGGDDGTSFLSKATAASAVLFIVFTAVSSVLSSYTLPRSCR